MDILYNFILPGLLGLLVGELLFRIKDRKRKEKEVAEQKNYLKRPTRPNR